PLPPRRVGCPRRLGPAPRARQTDTTPRGRRGCSPMQTRGQFPASRSVHIVQVKPPSGPWGPLSARRPLVLPSRHCPHCRNRTRGNANGELNVRSGLRYVQASTTAAGAARRRWAARFGVLPAVSDTGTDRGVQSPTAPGSTGWRQRIGQTALQAHTSAVLPKPASRAFRRLS
ncbi:MAG: hypothetical protein QG656_152, partial [Candidatus Hydrogenedentes bacterium]|nr:hypothetical protein [Candidatus Hydrogenedentota bacterium]